MGTATIILGRVVPALAVLGACGLAGVYGLELARSRAEREIYRERLESLVQGYEALAMQYNDAVRRTAVTELVVESGKLAVVVRTAQGELRRIDTPYNPSGEIYVDFVLVNGRVWIRRVFDASTPPALGTVIDPQFADVSWNQDGSSYGKAVYRSLDEGRWVVRVSGNGALELTKATESVAEVLQPPPQVSSFDEVAEEARREAEAITWSDLVNRMLGRG